MDVFYVKDRAGLKITRTSALENIQKTLLEALNMNYANAAVRAAE